MYQSITVYFKEEDYRRWEGILGDNFKSRQIRDFMEAAVEGRTKVVDGKVTVEPSEFEKALKEKYRKEISHIVKRPPKSTIIDAESEDYEERRKNLDTLMEKYKKDDNREGETIDEGIARLRKVIMDSKKDKETGT